MFINAMSENNYEIKSSLIKSAIEKQFDLVKNMSFGPDYLTKLNPNLILLFLKNVSDQTFKEIALEKLLSICPGLIDGWLMLSNSQSIKKAHKSLEKALELDPTNSEAHLMVANILIKQVNYFFILI